MAHILLIDDMNSVRRTISAVLKRAGHTVAEAEDGGVGLALIQGGQRFDLVITDMLMPKHDGTEVILSVAALPNRPKILAMSGGGSRVSSEEALTLARTKADAMLVKPFENAELIAMVDRLVAG
jgi:CheY-like chemotaxis protein